MKKKSIIILALMIVFSVLLNYFAFFGIQIGNFKYDSLFGEDLFGSTEVVTETQDAPAAEDETDAPEATEGEESPAETVEGETEEPATEETTEGEATEEAATEETAEEPAAEEATETTEEAAPAQPKDAGRIKKGIDLAGGSVISFEADTDKEITDADMDVVEAIFNTRLQASGYTEHRISRGELGQITVEIPAEFNTDKAANLLVSAAKLTFVNGTSGEVVLDGSDVKDATYKFGQTSEAGAAEAYVELTLNSDAVSKWAEATRNAIGSQIMIMMDETIVSAPTVNSEINSETCIISGSFTAETAQELANQIKSGALPFSLKIISQDTIGAELGQDALPTSLLAAGIGILLVMLFMIIFYRLPGLVADLALTIYIGLVALILGLIRANLSLSSIAGIVLSIGMAVDANVIIFERMKEELKLGKTIKASVESGFKKAFSAILDSNVTTIITCVVLYLSGISTIKGFAVTLGIGVVVSMFTAIIITKFLLKQVVNLNIKNRGLFYKVKKEAAEQ